MLVLSFLQTVVILNIPLAEWSEVGVDWITDFFDGAFYFLEIL